MSIVLCQSCVELACDPPSDFSLYSLDTTLYPPVVNCPPGSQCYLPGATIVMPCCKNEITRTVPGTATIDQWLAIIAEMLAECATQSAFCGGGIPPPPDQPDQPQPPPPQIGVFFNQRQCCDSFCTDGSKFTYCLQAGIVFASTTQQANAYARKRACNLAKTHKICLSAIPEQICANVAFSVQIQATGTGTKYPLMNYWSMVDGSLPTGLTFSGGWLNAGEKATITGTPTVGGIYGFSIRVWAPDGCEMTRNYTMCVLDIQPDPFPAITIGVPMSVQMSVAGCALTPLEWTVSSGALPTGLSLDAVTGIISGTPTAGMTSFEISVQTLST